MNLAGETIDNWLRVVRVHIDALGHSLDEALNAVPPEVRELVRRKWEEQNALPIRRTTVLSATGGPRPWYNGWDATQGYYWRRQRQYLIDRLGWIPADVESLDDSSDAVLSHLEDPRPGGPPAFNVRGLVMGYVQSGKTANFCAVTAKAADAGYKLVIVLSGVHNSLRQQTQRRVNRALGIDPTGVPLPEPGMRWIALTTDELHGDFRPGTVDANVLQGNERVVLVVKKNASVLRRLAGWMGTHAPASLPVLIIDDEADQASINTGGNRPALEDIADLQQDDLGADPPEDELDPSRINGLIRQLIGSFGRISYIAYTATPFANVLINHEATDREVMDDLYPRDFIVTLPRPNLYVGAERLFGRDLLPGEAAPVAGLDVLQFIPEHEADQLAPAARDIPAFVPLIPPSLRDALVDFIIALAARVQRSGHDVPATMLVHTHHRRPVQNLLGLAIREHLTNLRQAWRYDREHTRPVFARRWDEQFRPCIVSIDQSRDCAFDAIEPFIDRLFREPLPVIILNSDSDDILDYETNPTIKAVVVGGNRLSRGLTLEGLLVSYYIRRTQYFDTLLQMGRWFGYREDYVDLTRLYTTEELAGWFRDLALAEEDLRREIERYERERLTPLEFGPRIRSHPIMMITARNKMGSARVIQQNYSGRFVQTTCFRLNDRQWLSANLRAAQNLMSRMGAARPADLGPRMPVWPAVPWRVIMDFLSEYNFDPRGAIEARAIQQYLRTQVDHGELTEWCVSIRGRRQRDPDLGDEPSLAVPGLPFGSISRTRLRNAPHSIGSLINPATVDSDAGTGDEETGLDLDALRQARAEAMAGEDFPAALRRRRPARQGLLLLYPISPHSRPVSRAEGREPLFNDPVRDGCCVVGAALVFPVSDSNATIEYVVGSVGALTEEQE